VKKRIQSSPYVSIGLTIINIILFLLCTFVGNLLYNKGGLSPYSFFEEKEYYRVFTSMFLHGDIEHLINNMLLLCGLGAMIEKEVGHTTFAIAYFVTGFGGNAASLWYKIAVGEYDVLSIGASGAVFGLIGVLLVMALLPGVYMPSATPVRILFVIGYSIYCGMQETNIDNAAHVGGVLCGIVFGSFVFGVLRKGFFRRTKEQPNNIEDGGYYED
jgi:rhomboid protease GluP